MQVEEKDTVKVETSHGKIRLLDNDTKENIVEVSTDEETRVNSSHLLVPPLQHKICQSFKFIIFSLTK